MPVLVPVMLEQLDGSDTSVVLALPVACTLSDTFRSNPVRPGAHLDILAGSPWRADDQFSDRRHMNATDRLHWRSKLAHCQRDRLD